MSSSTTHCCSSTTGEVQGGQPTLVECIRFRGRDRRINISQEIGTKYITFGTLLLEERTGERVSAIAHKHAYDCEQASLEILEEWVAGRGKQPVTWNTLIEILHDIKLSTLAREIEAVKFPAEDVEDKPAEVIEDSKERTSVSDACTTEDSDSSIDIHKLHAVICELLSHFETEQSEASANSGNSNI